MPSSSRLLVSDTILPDSYRQGDCGKNHFGKVLLSVLIELERVRGMLKSLTFPLFENRCQLVRTVPPMEQLDYSTGFRTADGWLEKEVVIVGHSLENRFQSEIVDRCSEGLAYRFRRRSMRATR